MLSGRHIVKKNWKNADFLWLIEFPGFWIFLMDRLLGFQDRFCLCAFSIVAMLLGAHLPHAIFSSELTQRFIRYVGPEENPELKTFLEDETPAMCGVSAADKKFDTANAKFSSVQTWSAKWFDNSKCEGEKTWEEVCPVHCWLIECKPGDKGDAEGFGKFLDNVENKCLEQPLKEMHDVGPLQLSDFHKFSCECTLPLLKRGANPHQEDCSVHAVMRGMQDPWELSTLKPSSLGFSEGFWERFYAICIEKSPPEVSSRWDRFLRIVRSF